MAESQPHYERLTAMDTSFLILEKPESPLHVSATLIYETGPLATEDGGLDIDAYRAATEAARPPPVPNTSQARSRTTASSAVGAATAGRHTGA